MTDGSVVRERLFPTEQLLWHGQPRGGLTLRTSDAFLIPFSLLWGGFAFFWEWGVIHSGAPFFFWIWGIPFVLIGLYLIFGRFFWDAYQRAHTWYGVTSERVVIVTRGLGTSVMSLSLRTLSDVTLMGSEDLGSIRFGSGTGSRSTWIAGSGWPGATAAIPILDRLEEPKQVYETILRAQKALPQGTR